MKEKRLNVWLEEPDIGPQVIVFGYLDATEGVAETRTLAEVVIPSEWKPYTFREFLEASSLLRVVGEQLLLSSSQSSSEEGFF